MDGNAGCCGGVSCVRRLSDRCAGAGGGGSKAAGVPHTPSSFTPGQTLEPENMVEKVRGSCFLRQGRSGGCLDAGRQAGWLAAAAAATCSVVQLRLEAGCPELVGGVAGFCLVGVRAREGARRGELCTSQAQQRESDWAHVGDQGDQQEEVGGKDAVCSRQAYCAVANHESAMVRSLGTRRC